MRREWIVDFKTTAPVTNNTATPKWLRVGVRRVPTPQPGRKPIVHTSTKTVTRTCMTKEIAIRKDGQIRVYKGGAKECAEKERINYYYLYKVLSGKKHSRVFEVWLTGNKYPKITIFKI